MSMASGSELERGEMRESGRSGWIGDDKAGDEADADAVSSEQSK